jgi:hypothetical protein
MTKSRRSRCLVEWFWEETCARFVCLAAVAAVDWAARIYRQRSEDQEMSVGQHVPRYFGVFCEGGFGCVLIVLAGIQTLSARGQKAMGCLRFPPPSICTNMYLARSGPTRDMVEFEMMKRWLGFVRVAPDQSRNRSLLPLLLRAYPSAQALPNEIVYNESEQVRFDLVS